MYVQTKTKQLYMLFPIYIYSQAISQFCDLVLIAKEFNTVNHERNYLGVFANTGLQISHQSLFHLILEFYKP